MSRPTVRLESSQYILIADKNDNMYLHVGYISDMDWEDPINYKVVFNIPGVGLITKNYGTELEDKCYIINNCFINGESYRRW